MTNGEPPNYALIFFGGLFVGIVSSLIAQVIYDYYKKEFIIKTAQEIIKKL